MLYEGRAVDKSDVHLVMLETGEVLRCTNWRTGNWESRGYNVSEYSIQGIWEDGCNIGN
jgi:hypothetical protein